MKKFLAIFLTVMLLLSMATMFVAAGYPVMSNEIVSINFFDFSAENNKWAERDADGNLIKTSFTGAEMENGHYPHALFAESYSYDDNVSYEFTNGGEVMKIFTTDQTKDGGLAFRVATTTGDIPLGAESAKRLEYIKIRIKNNSPSTKFTLGAGITGGGSQDISSKTFGTLDIESNSSEWKTYTFSMKDLNYDTQNRRGNSDARWSGSMRQFVFFPFGQGVDREAIAGDQYYMEIDYIVMGSLEYVNGYESELEKKEKRATDFEFISSPTTTTYYTGDRLDLSGLQAKITFDGDPANTEIVDTASAVYNFEKPANLGDDVKTWQTNIKLIYGSKYLEYPVTVVDIDSIDFATYQENEVYNKIDILKAGGFTPEGMTIKVNYADGTSKVKQLYEITLEGDNFTEQDIPLSDDGYYHYIVTAKFYGHAVTFPVKLIDIKELKLTAVEGMKNSVYYGTSISKDFFDIVCVYTDGTEVALADSGLADYFSVACDKNIAGGDAVATAKLVNAAYDINVTTDVNVKVQTPIMLEAKCKTRTPKLEAVIPSSQFSVQYVYADGTRADISTDDPNLVINYDTSTPGAKVGKAKIGKYAAEFSFTVGDVNPDDLVNSFVRDGGKVSLLKAKFPTFWLVTIIVAAVVLVLAAAFCVLKFVFKVDFKPKKRFNLDEIF